MNVFDYVNSINITKKNLMRDSENDELMEKEYVPYIVNKSLSYFTDTLLYANEINRYGFLDNKMQYEYLLNSVRQGKRFSKWAKKDSSVVIDSISRYYQVNKKRAEEYALILTDQQKQEILERTQDL